MRKWLFAFVAGIPLAIAGCGGGTSDLSGSTSTAENEALAVAMVGGASAEGTIDAEASDEVASQAQADMNAQIIESLASKVEQLLNEELENEDFRAELMDAEAQASLSKDINVSIGLKGLRVDIVDEVIPFAGGTMNLNGDLALKLRYRGGGELALEADGELLSDLEGVERAGYIGDLPYYLSLDGSNYMGMNGSFSITIKWWKVSKMSADFTASVINSDVVATGTIAERSVVGSVDLVDMSIILSNSDLLKNPKAFTVSCTGTIETSFNDEVVAGCTMDSSCKSCK